jgi:hypothetical protein
VFQWASVVFFADPAGGRSDSGISFASMHDMKREIFRGQLVAPSDLLKRNKPGCRDWVLWLPHIVLRPDSLH